MTDNKVPFLILATRQGGAPFTAQFYVRATSLADAYARVLKEQAELCQHPDIRLQGFVASAGMMAQALNLQALARFYWNLARSSDEIGFDDAWDEHGAEPDVE